MSIFDRDEDKDVRFNLEGRRYRWVGTFGNLIESYEKGVKRHDVRVIGGELFYANYVTSWDAPPFSKCVSWTLLKPSAKAIAEFKKKALP